MNACACLGPIMGEPYCPCTMERLGLERSESWKAANTPEALEAEKARLNKALAAMFESNKREKSEL